MFFTLPNPHPETPARPSTPKMLQVREHAPTPYSSVVFTLNSHLIYQGGWGTHHYM